MALLIRDLIEKRNRLFKEAQDLNAKATNEARNLDAAESLQWNKLMDEVAGLKDQIGREERTAKVAAELETDMRTIGHLGNGNGDADKDIEQRKVLAFRNFLQGKQFETRDLQVDTDVKGGFWVPQLVQDKIRIELD